MRFGSLIIAGLAAVASAIPAAKVVENIKTVASLSTKLQTPTKDLSVLDGPLLAIGSGNFPPVIKGFTEIVNTVSGALNNMDEEKYSPADSDLIFDAFRTFVMVHQELLNILIGKAGLFNTVPLVGKPVASVLHAVEGVVDSLANSLIDMMESRTMEMKEEALALGSTLGTCIGSYEGLSLN